MLALGQFHFLRGFGTQVRGLRVVLFATCIVRKIIQRTVEMQESLKEMFLQIIFHKTVFILVGSTLYRYNLA